MRGVRPAKQSKDFGGIFCIFSQIILHSLPASFTGSLTFKALVKNNRIGTVKNVYSSQLTFTFNVLPFLVTTPRSVKTIRSSKQCGSSFSEIRFSTCRLVQFFCVYGLNFVTFELKRYHTDLSQLNRVDVLTKGYCVQLSLYFLAKPRIFGSLIQGTLDFSLTKSQYWQSSLEHAILSMETTKYQDGRRSVTDYWSVCNNKQSTSGIVCFV